MTRLGMIVPRWKALPTEEHQNDLAGHVIGGEECGEERDDPQRLVLTISVEQDFVFRPEPGERRYTSNRQPAHEERSGSDGHPLAKVAHALHVLFFADHAVHAMDHRTSAKEHQCFKEGVSDHMENRGNVAANAHGQEHETELADGGIGQHFLDVVLRGGNRGRKQGGKRTDPCNQRHDPGVGCFQQRMYTYHQVHARGNHRCGVDEGGHRRGAFHRVGQPDVQWQLR